MHFLKKGILFPLILLTLSFMVPRATMAATVEQQIQNLAADTPEASVSSQGVTIDVKKTLADPYNLFILCSMTLPEGMSFTDDMRWFGETLIIGGEEVASIGKDQILEQKENKRIVLYTFSMRDKPLQSSNQVRFEIGQPIRFKEDDSIVPIIEGEWVLEWQVEKEAYIEMESDMDANINGTRVTVKSLTVSPMAVSVIVESDGGIQSIAPVVQMKNGSVGAYTSENEIKGGRIDYANPNQPKHLNHSMCLFNNMINVQDVVSVKVGETVIPMGTSTQEPSNWAALQVNEAIHAGIVPNHLQNSYTKAITRGEFCTLAVNLYESVTGAEITQRQSFNDTSDINIEKMAALDVVQGVGDNQFAPERTLSREQAAAMLSRLSGALGKPLPQGNTAFADNDQIGAWAAMTVAQVHDAGIMAGVGNNRFEPEGEYTREQSIITMLRLYKLVY